MHEKWRRTAVSCATLAALTTAGCGAGSAGSSPDAQGAAATSAGPSAVPAVGTSTAGPSGAADPSDLPTNAPVTTTPGAELVVFVTDAGWDAASRSVQENSFVQGTVRSGGTCTLTLTKDGVTASGSVAGEADATTTSCSGASVPGSELSSGTWSAVVSYESGRARGSSVARQVIVP